MTWDPNSQSYKPTLTKFENVNVEFAEDIGDLWITITKEGQTVKRYQVFGTEDGEYCFMEASNA